MKYQKGLSNFIIDTDAFNEIDDQFALTHALLTAEQNCLAVYAAPFLNKRAKSPLDGMKKSYDEILRIFNLCNIPVKNRVFHGAQSFIKDPHRLPPSIASEDLINRAKSSKEKLIIISIGAPTNISIALMRDKKITRKIKVIWLGGHARWWPHTDEFNLKQDKIASRILLESEVELVRIPVYGVTSHLSITLSELKEIKNYGRIGKYLFQIFSTYIKNYKMHSKILWDMAAVASVILPEAVCLSRRPAIKFNKKLKWKEDNSHSIIEAYFVNRDIIFADFMEKLKAKFK